MDHARVAVVDAPSYEEKALAASLSEALSLLGGLDAFVRPTDHVFVKVNHLSPPSPPEKAIVTHPSFTEAVLKNLLELTPHVSFGDDVQAKGDAFGPSSYRALADRLPATLVNLKEHGFSSVDCNGEVLSRTYIARALLEADVIINLPKLKTHALTTLTGAIKNLYGVIPAGLRSGYHGQFSQPERFNQAIVDIYATLPPQLHIMDAVVAMEGEGPAGGRPRPVGLVLASPDGVALDAVATRVMGLDPMAIATTRIAHGRKLGKGELEAIEVMGRPLDSFVDKPFVLPSSAPVRLLGRVPTPVARLAARQLTARPTVSPARCVRCGECVRICPVGAATMGDRTARIDRKTCIRCMCCLEVCRYDAVLLRRSPQGQALHTLLQLGRRYLSSR